MKDELKMKECDIRNVRYDQMYRAGRKSSNPVKNRDIVVKFTVSGCKRMFMSHTKVRVQHQVTAMYLREFCCGPYLIRADFKEGLLNLTTLLDRNTSDTDTQKITDEGTDKLTLRLLDRRSTPP